MDSDIIEEIFSRLLSVDDSQREETLSQLCSDNKELKKEVLELLSAAAACSGFLSESPYIGLRGKLAQPQLIGGEKLGPYKLLREIGRGGMGIVFLAEHADGIYQKRVAIKLLQHNFHNDIELKRFISERQILAGLKHPNIACLVDDGNTTNIKPYLVMEYIHGVPINKYCEKTVLSLKDKLELFLTVCKAVQYAHQNLIIHRDLKPGNILVTSAGVPKLIDFGTAKLIASPESSQQGPKTLAGVLPLTLEYAAPEQLTGGAITTATDVYALGVILYELLTGQRPYKVSIDNISAIVKSICKANAPRPSRVAPQNCRSELRGDLDSIVLRCLHKKVENRYETVSELSDDISDYLRNRPIKAHAQTMSYHFLKSIIRNKWMISLTSLLIAFLFNSASLAEGQWTFANEERAHEEQLCESI